LRALATLVALSLATATLLREPAPARGADSMTAEPDASVELGRAHFRRGVALYRSRAYDAALAEFTRANEAAPSFRILYNLAQIQVHRHDYVAAHALFSRYLSDGGERVAEPRQSEVRAEMLELEQRISRLRVDTNIVDVRLFVNDLPAAVPGRDEPLSLNAGIYRLRAEKDGYVSVSRTLTLTGGDDTSVSLELSAELEMDDAPQPAPSPAPLPGPQPVDRSAFWASLAVTGALTGATVTLGLLARRANSTLDARLARQPAEREAVEESRQRVRTFALLTDLCGVAAATALGVTTYFYFSADEPSERLVPQGLRPELGPQSVGLAWSREF
jgi:hypothetical protein